MQFFQSILIFATGFLILSEIRASKKTNFFVPTRLDCHLSSNLFSNYTCLLKAISRTKKIVGLRGVLAKPVNKLFVNYQLYKRYNGWQPFLMNYTFEFCNFLKDGKGLASHFYNYLYKPALPLLSKYTNINHPCPYNGTIELYEVDLNLAFKENVENLLVPSGYYKAKIEFQNSRNLPISTIIFQLLGDSGSCYDNKDDDDGHVIRE
ncbi:uncharacterized protein LOC129613371 [Condylostylus longicornis]|uniref:uncharacterized protein LOC129613371 n=1 Tax=Condylostylus longicornis TaxID=2530218 RepID=UPI00244DEA45|nr:uncharacterized protein LOC129613371 [Condylostylus longicornis]